LLPLILFVAGFVSDYKNAMDELKPLILHILNTIIEELDIPQMLKRGTMTPVLKKNKDRQNPAIFRSNTHMSPLIPLWYNLLKRIS
jgi:hypothetical protein